MSNTAIKLIAALLITLGAMYEAFIAKELEITVFLLLAVCLIMADIALKCMKSKKS